MTMLQELLIEVGESARRVDPAQLAGAAIETARQRRRRARGLALVGALSVSALSVGAALASTRGDSLLGSSQSVLFQAGSGGSPRAFYSGGPRDQIPRALVAGALALTAAAAVGLRERLSGRGPGVGALERVVAGAWGASVGLWLFSAIRLFAAIARHDRFFGHPYVAMASQGIVPVLAVALMTVGAPALRRLTILALAGQAAVTLSLLYPALGHQSVRGASHWVFALALVQIAAVLAAAAWPGGSAPRDRRSPSWQLAAVWAAPVPVLANLFIFAVNQNNLLYRTGPNVQIGSWSAAGVASLLVGWRIMRPRVAGAAIAVVVGLLIYLPATFVLAAYPNTLPSLWHDWGPLLGGWFLAGLLVLLWLVAHGRVVARRSTSSALPAD